LFKGFSEPASYTGAFCHTSARQTVDFTAPKCKARQFFEKNENEIMLLMVERDWQNRDNVNIIFGKGDALIMCTIGVTYKKNKGFILFKNRDLNQVKENPDPVIAKGEIGKYIKFGVSSGKKKPGVWGGVNDSGVGILGADGNSLQNFTGKGYTNGEKTWETYEEVLSKTDNVRDAYKFLIDAYEDQNIGGTGDIILIADTDRAAVLEYLPHKWGIEFIENHQDVIRTNFFQIMQHIRPPRDMDSVTLSSHLRFERAFQIISQTNKNPDVEMIKKLCQDHWNGPSEYSICRHGGKDKYNTLCSAIMDVQNDAIHAHYIMNNHPCNERYKIISLDRQGN